MANTSSSSGVPQGLISLSNTVHSEIAPSLPLASLPVFCGAVDQDFRLFDDYERRSNKSSRSLNSRSDLLGHAAKIADLLHNTDVSYLLWNIPARVAQLVEHMAFIMEVSGSKPPAYDSREFAFWVELVESGEVTSPVWLAGYCTGAGFTLCAPKKGTQALEH